MAAGWASRFRECVELFPRRSHAVCSARFRNVGVVRRAGEVATHNIAAAVRNPDESWVEHVQRATQACASLAQRRGVEHCA
eukprot:9481203-Pyramimonas_sp.AAC.1